MINVTNSLCTKYKNYLLPVLLYALHFNSSIQIRSPESSTSAYKYECSNNPLAILYCYRNCYVPSFYNHTSTNVIYKAIRNKNVCCLAGK